MPAYPVQPRSREAHALLALLNPILFGRFAAVLMGEVIWRVTASDSAGNAAALAP